MEQLYKYFSLSSQVRILLSQAFLLLGFIHVGLWLFPFRYLDLFVKWAIANSVNQKQLSAVTEETIIWAIETATSYLPGQPKCLARALATKVLLHRYGYTCDLRIGVTKSSSLGLTAHAWIERDGHVLIGGGRDLSSFTLLPSRDN